MSYIDGIKQNSYNSGVLTMKLHLFCVKSSIWDLFPSLNFLKQVI